jgi:hypothetical protein
MQPIYILLASAAVTGGIVYGIYYLTASKKVKSKDKASLKDIDPMVTEGFLDEIEEEFEARVNAEAPLEKTSKSIEEYPDCFGTSEKSASCAHDCSVARGCF